MAFAGVLVSVSSAQAGVFTYDYTSATLCNGSSSCLLDNPMDHPDVNKNTSHVIEGFVYSEIFDDTFSALNLTSDTNGLGVNWGFDSDQIDGLLGTDSVVLGFEGVAEHQVSLLELTIYRGENCFFFFCATDEDDDFSLWADGVLVGNFGVDIGDADDCSGVYCTFTFGEGLYGKEFSIEALGSNDQFRIVNATFAVPEPSALGLLGLGLMGVVLVRRRKMAA